MKKQGIACILTALLLMTSLLAGCGGQRPATESSDILSEPSEGTTEPSVGTTEQSEGTTASSEGGTTVAGKTKTTGSATTGKKVNQTIAVNKTFKPITADDDEVMFDNPDRGFRTEYQAVLSEAAESYNTTAYFEGKFRIYIGYVHDPCKLMYVYMNIADYRDKDISQDAMKALQTFFDMCRQKKIKLMLSFFYCNHHNDPRCTCANQETILRHIKQLKPIIAKNKDVIHTIKGGFIGTYGEWVPEYQEYKVDYPTVIKAIMDNFCIPNNLYFQIRMREYKEQLSAEDLKKYGKWIGYTNDAMFGEQTRTDWNSGYYQKGLKNKNGVCEWEEVMKEGYLTPQEGELFTNSNMIETNRKVIGKEIILETAHHWHATMSIWHGYYDVSRSDDAIMQAWMTDWVTPKWLNENGIVYCPSWFKDSDGNEVERNAFEFLRDHLGYKLEAQNLKINGPNSAGSIINVTMTLKNYGMAAAFNMESGFAILDEDYQVVSTVKAGDPTKWYSHPVTDPYNNTVPTHSISASMKLPNKSGNYYVAFYLKNTMGEMARLGNDLETADGYNLLYQFEM